MADYEEWLVMARDSFAAGDLPEPKFNGAADTEAELVHYAFACLDAEAKRLHIDITFHLDKVRYSEGGLIIFPVTWNTKITTREEAERMILLEDAWNEQEPAPLRGIRLADVWNPEISIRSTPPPPLNQTV